MARGRCTGLYRKAKIDARKHLIKIKLNGRTIIHEVQAKFSAAHVKIKPADEGHGLKLAELCA